MKIRQTTRTPAVLEELGNRVERLRLQQNRGLADLARDAGVGIATLQRLETGKNVNFRTYIQVLRVLNRLADIDNIIPEIETSPFEISKRIDAPHKRASRSDG